MLNSKDAADDRADRRQEFRLGAQDAIEQGHGPQDEPEEDDRPARRRNNGWRRWESNDPANYE